MDVRRTIYPTYKATRQTLAQRRAMNRRRQLERLDPPLAWVLSGPAWPCCPLMAAEPILPTASSEPGIQS